MKIAVIGTGAVGGYFGVKLAVSGYDVKFIATEKSAKAIKEHGFYITSPKGDIELKDVIVYSDIKQIADCDVILVCTKAYDTLKVAKDIKPVIKDSAVVISFQNGIENEDILASVLGKKHIIAASIYLSAASDKPGIIVHGGSGQIIIGELDGEITDRLKELERLFLSANIPCKTSGSLTKDMWLKLIVNSAYNGITALIEQSLHNIGSVNEAKELYFEILKEGQKVANAEGIDISDEDVAKIFSMLEQPVFINFKSSTLQDLEKGKPLEIDSIQGTIVKLGKKHAVLTPLNSMLYGLLKLKSSDNAQLGEK